MFITTIAFSSSNSYRNIQSHAIEYYENGTLHSKVNSWASYGALSEPLLRYMILLSIDNNSFSENLYRDYKWSHKLIQYLLEYKFSTLHDNFNLSKSDYSWNCSGVDIDIDNFTVGLANKLLERKNLSNIELFFLDIYSNKFHNSFEVLKTQPFDGTTIQKYYLWALGDGETFIDEQSIKSTQFNGEITMKIYHDGGVGYNKTFFHYEIIIGSHIPQNNLSAFSPGMILGFKGGAQVNKVIADLNLTIMGASLSKKEVYTNVDDEDILIDNIIGIYFGLDLGYKIIGTVNSSFDIIGGVGINSFSVYRDEEGLGALEDDLIKNISSLNLNIGLGYKYYYSTRNYFGINTKYNFVDFKNPKGSDLNGNIITIGLSWGFAPRRYYDALEKQLY